VARIIGVGREVVARRRDGSEFPAELAVGEARRPDGTRRFVGFVRDITDRRLMLDRLRAQEEELRLTFEKAPQGMLTTDLEGVVTRVNHALVTALGVAEDTLIGRRLFSLLDIEDARVPSLWSDFVGGRTMSLQFSGVFHRQGGDVLMGVIHCGLAHDPEGGPKLVVVHLEDRTERLRAEAEATRHREKLAHVARVSTMGEMATAIAHEVNQPLTAISVFAQASKRMMELDRIDRDELLDTLVQISHEAQRAGDIIHRLRALIRKRESRRVASDLNGLIRDAMSLADVDARQRNITLRLDLEEVLPIVYVDAIQVQQVVLNLVRNAIEATPNGQANGAVVLVRTERSAASEVRVSVRDEGMGLSPEAAEGLFRQFFTTKDSGMGLGLSISKTIVESHGGRMGFAANPEQGTTFFFTLPIGGGVNDELD
jgi:two-component system sensor kinase FixL